MFLFASGYLPLKVGRERVLHISGFKLHVCLCLLRLSLCPRCWGPLCIFIPTFPGLSDMPGSMQFLLSHRPLRWFSSTDVDIVDIDQ